MDKKEFQRVSFTLKGRIFFPKLFVPEASDLNPRKKFSVMFAWDIGSQPEQMAKIQEHIKAGVESQLKGIPQSSIMLPVKTWGKYQRKDGKPNPEFLRDTHWMNVSSGEEFKPVLVDKHKQEVISPAEVYSGRNAAVNFSFWIYNNKNYGISANLNAVMLLDGGEREGGGVNVEDAFSAFTTESTVTNDNDFF